MNDVDYERGRRRALVGVLGQCLRELRYDTHDYAERGRYVAEREEAIAVLRRACEQFGDNNWAENLSLADIIEKHLVRHLEADYLDDKM